MRVVERAFLSDCSRQASKCIVVTEPSTNPRRSRLISAMHQQPYEDKSVKKECRSMYIMSLEDISLDASPSWRVPSPSSDLRPHQHED